MPMSLFSFQLSEKCPRIFVRWIFHIELSKISNAHHLYDATLKFAGRSAIAARMSNNAPGFLFSSQLSGKHKTICEGSIFLMELKIIFNIFNVLIWKCEKRSFFASSRNAILAKSYFKYFCWKSNYLNCVFMPKL